MTAYTFDRMGKTYVCLWHKTGSGNLNLGINEEFSYVSDLGKEEIPAEKKDGKIILPDAQRSYFTADVSKADLIKAFEAATIEK